MQPYWNIKLGRQRKEPQPELWESLPGLRKFAKIPSSRFVLMNQEGGVVADSGRGSSSDNNNNITWWALYWEFYTH